MSTYNAANWAPVEDGFYHELNNGACTNCVCGLFDVRYCKRRSAPFIPFDGTITLPDQEPEEEPAMSVYQWIRTRTAVLMAVLLAVIGFALGQRRERKRWTGRF